MAEVEQDPFPETAPGPLNLPPGTFRLQDLRTPFRKDQISKLKKRYKDKQGEWHEISLDYVGHADITARLLDVDPEWNWRPAGHREDGTPCLVYDKEGHPIGLWIYLTVCGVSRLGFGSCESGKPDAVKELIGDAIRNAAMRFGCGLELWSKTQREGYGEAATPPERPQAAPVTPASVAEAFGGKVEPGESGQAAAPRKILGVNVPGKYSLEGAKAHLVSFGKHKGKTLGQLLGDPEGRSYIEWLAQKTATEIREGTRQKIYAGDYLVLLVYDTFHAPGLVKLQERVDERAEAGEWPPAEDESPF